MATPYEIPLTATPQKFTISLAGVSYQITVRWNKENQAWTLDIADSLGVAIISGIPLVTGADLLAQYAYLNFNGALYCFTDNDIDAVPTFDNLGSNGHLYFVTNP